MYKFVIRKNKHGEFVVRFMWHGEVMFTSPPYSKASAAKDAIAAIKTNALDAAVEDKT